MNSDVLLIILTENSWLYEGVVALMPDMVCLKAEFDTYCLPTEIRYAARVLVVVDSRVFLRGEWIFFDALKSRRPDASVVWLTCVETGLVFPEESNGDLILNQWQDPISLRRALLRRARWDKFLKSDERVSAPDLTFMERLLLPYFMSGESVSKLSLFTGVPAKILYVHRRRILIKMGFRQLAFLQFVYKCNNWEGRDFLGEERDGGGSG